MHTAVVVLSWNGLADTRQCVESVVRSDATDFGVIVVDSGSEPAEASALLHWLMGRFGVVETLHSETGSRCYEAEQKSGGCTYIGLVLLGTNRGYGSGNNAGIRKATAVGARFVWILNNDTTVSPSALRLLQEFADGRDGVGAIGSLVLRHADPTQVECLGGAQFSAFSTRRRNCGEGPRERLVSGKAERLDYISGCSMFLSTNVLAEVGGLPEHYFLYFEELDLCRRLTVAGYRLWVEPRAIVFHKGGAASGSVPQYSRRSALAAYYAARSSVVFVRRFHRWCTPAAVVSRLGLGLLLLRANRSVGLASLRGVSAGLRASVPSRAATQTTRVRL